MKTKEIKEKKRTTIWIESDVWSGAGHVAIDKKVSVSELIEELLRREVEKSPYAQPRQPAPAGQ
jgi:predicted DNA-binding ribbon-helix-helix protein